MEKQEKFEMIDFPEGEVEPNGRHDIRKFTQPLPTPITDNEYRALTIRRAQLDTKIAEAETRKKIVAKQCAADIENYKGEIDEINASLISGELTREVDCEKIFDYNAGKVLVIRKDTGDVVESREMRANERQGELFDDD